MTITRANTETILIKRIGQLMAVPGLDGTTVDGTNEDANDPIGYALRTLDYDVASVVLVADVDLDDVDADDYDALFDLAEVRALENTLGNLNLVDIQVGPRREALSDFGERLEAMIARKRKQIADDYGIGLGTIEAGVIRLDFADKED